MAKKKIILIDDEPDFVKNVQSFFQLHGYECAVAYNGQEGLDKIVEEKPLLVVLDILMPNMDGYTMLREMKKRNINLPCVVLTAKEKLKELFELEKVDRFLAKPFDLDRLKEIVEETLRGTYGSSIEDEGDSTVSDKDPSSEKRILIIEDEVKLAENIKKYLELKGFQAFTAHTGEKGLEGVDKYKPDAIITDVMMPQMDGYSMIRELKRRGARIPIIVLTAKEKLKDLIEMEGVDAFMTKPFDINTLETKLREILIQ